MSIFPPLIARMMQSTIIKLIAYIGFHVLFINLILPQIGCVSACVAVATAASAGTAAPAAVPACKIGCQAVAYGIMYAARNAATAFIVGLIEEVSEPFMLVNYPANFMSIPGSDEGPKDEEYLKWNCPSSDYNNCFISELATNTLSAGDWQAIGLSVAEAGLDGFIDGMFAGLSKGGTVSKAATSWYRKAAVKSLKIAATGLVQSLSFAARMELKKASGIAALQFDLPSAFRPTGYVGTLLAHRRAMSLDEFVTIGWGDVCPIDHVCEPGEALSIVIDLFNGDKNIIQASSGLLDFLWDSITALIDYAKNPKRVPNYSVTDDSRVTDFNGFEVVNCVSISELGPLCDSESKVLMDYDHDLYMSYRITDPINHPEKAIFCGYDGAKGEMNIDIIKIMIDYIRNLVLKNAEGDDLLTLIVNAFLSGIEAFLQLAIGDWLLAGMTNMQGLFMECVQQHYQLDYRSEYFQYWVPYSDESGLTGTTGNIGAIIAKMVPQDSDVTACKNGYLAQWNTCYNNYISWATGTTVSQTHTLSELLDAESAVCSWDGTSINCASGNLPNPSNISCIDVYHAQYLGCNKGIHLSFAGVLQ